MRLFRLVLLGVLAFVLSVMFLFPAAPVVERIRPMIQPAQLEGVSGKLLAGRVERVSYDDGVMLLDLQSVTWRLAPRKLLSAAAGVKLTFDAYGGRGDGLFARHINGDMSVTDVNFEGPAKGLEALLPLPIAAFNGKLVADIEQVLLEGQLLKSFEGNLVWSDAVLESPERANLGNVTLDVTPASEQVHRATLKASGGEVEVDGTVDLAQNGDFTANILVTPRSDAAPELLDVLRGMGRPDSDGRYRIQQNGNVNRLM